MRHATLVLLAAALAVVTPEAIAQCTGTAGTDFQRVTIREINTIPQSNIDQLNAAGASLTGDQISALVQSPLSGERVEFQAVILTDPLKSGLASANDGIPGRIHVFMRDVAAATDGNAGMGIQIVDNRGDGTIQQFFVGDEVTVCGEVTYFNSTLQLAPESISSNSNPRSPGDPILDPIVVTTGDIHDTFVVNGETRSQVDWNVYGDFVNQYVRFANAELIQGLPGTRPNMLFSTTGEDATVRSYDTSVCYRNDRDASYFPANQEPACNQTDFVPPPTGIVNVQGFLTLAGTFDAFGSSIPPGGAFALSPFEATDFEIAVAPPIVVFDATPIPSPSAGALIRATVTPGTTGNTIASVVADYSADGTSGQVALTNTSGDVYEGTIPNLAAGTFVTYTVTATDNQGAASESDPISRRVIDGPISSIFDIQATPEGGPGNSGVTTSAPVAFNLDAVVQTAYETGSRFQATIQDDPSLGVFSGIVMDFGSTDPGLSVGDQINISEARVTEFTTAGGSSLTQLVNVTFTVTGSGDPYPAKVVTTNLFNGPDGAATAEQHEGMLLKFEDATVTSTNPDGDRDFGEFAFSSDGTEANDLRADDSSNDIPDGFNATLAVGQGITIQGYLTETFGNYKLIPISTDDIVLGPVSVGTGPGEARVEIQSAFPNPTAGAVRVRFALATPGEVSLRVYDATGREVATLAEGAFGADTHEVSGSLSGLASGVYVVRLQAGGESATARVAVIR